MALQLENEGVHVSRATVQRALRSDSSMRPYHERPIHELKDADKPRRIEMARVLLEKIEEDPDFLENILWSDEATFKLNGAVNSHNTVFWSSQNPQRKRIRNSIDQRGICVWAGIWAGGRIGPFEIDSRLTAVQYQNFLRENILPKLGDHSRYWFMRDGAPAYKARST